MILYSTNKRLYTLLHLDFTVDESKSKASVRDVFIHSMTILKSMERKGKFVFIKEGVERDLLTDHKVLVLMPS